MKRLAVLLGLFLLVAGVVQANTLQNILDRGKLIVGCDLTAPPYGTIDAQGNPTGMDVILARALAADLGVQLEIVDTSAPNRIVYLLTRKIDIAIAGFSVTAERAKSVAFTIPYFMVSLGLCVNVQRAPDIHSVADLVGRTVAVNKGSTPHLALEQVAPPGTKFLLFDTASAAALAAKTGQADAFAEGYAIMQRYVDENPGLFEIRGEPYRRDAVSFGVRHEDLIWLHYVNTWLDIKYRTGLLKSLYVEWIKLPWEAGDPRR